MGNATERRGDESDDGGGTSARIHPACGRTESERQRDVPEEERQGKSDIAG